MYRMHKNKYIETEINLPQDWIIKSLEISVNDLPYVGINGTRSIIGSTNSITNLAEQENVELQAYYSPDPINGIPCESGFIMISFN